MLFLARRLKEVLRAMRSKACRRTWQEVESTTLDPGIAVRQATTAMPYVPRLSPGPRLRRLMGIAERNIFLFAVSAVLVLDANRKGDPMRIPQGRGQASPGDIRYRRSGMTLDGERYHIRPTARRRALSALAAMAGTAERHTLEKRFPGSNVKGRYVRWRSFWFIALIAISFAPSPLPAAAFPPKRNAAWVYDPPARHGGHKATVPGYFASSIVQYNERAKRGSRIGELYVYGGDMEMYCPDHEDSGCSAQNFYVFYSSAAQHGTRDSGSGHNDKNESVQAYTHIFHQDTSGNGSRLDIVPIIDGVISGRGALHGFDNLSQAQSDAFADKVARQICADSAVDGVQFDLEPFGVSRKAGQYYFYKRIGRDFASRKMGCVDEGHPKGRFFSIFTVANRIRPNTAGAKHVRQIMHTAGNGYLIDALYDLEGTPPGHRTPVAAYRRLVMREVRHMRDWASLIDVKYQFGVPAAASAHEFSACAGVRCQKTQKGERGSDMQLRYVKTAIAAIDENHCVDAPGYLGVALWAWSAGLPYKGMHFSPTKPSTKVQQYLAKGLAKSG